LLLHAAVDTVTPTEQSIDLFAHAKQPAELHLFSDVDHFLLAGENQIVHATLASWLSKYFPLQHQCV
jgi:dipeptidyl aminopeptidase/acylaminoacyl peptidase